MVARSIISAFGCSVAAAVGSVRATLPAEPGLTVPYRERYVSGPTKDASSGPASQIHSACPLLSHQASLSKATVRIPF